MQGMKSMLESIPTSARPSNTDTIKTHESATDRLGPLFIENGDENHVKEDVARVNSKHRTIIWLLAVVTAVSFLLYNVSMLFVDYHSIIEGGRFAPPDSLEDLKGRPNYDKVFGENYWGLAESNSVDIKEMFIHCAWEGVTIDCAKHISSIITPVGRCFQFNQDPQKARQAVRSGFRGGLSAILRIDPALYTKSENDAVGVRILFHDQNDYPDVFSNGIVFAPGSSYYIGFTLSTFKFLPYPFKAMMDGGYCASDDTEDYEPKVDKYSMKYCIYHKASVATEKACGCSQMTCNVYWYLHCFKPIFEEFYGNTSSTKGVFDCPLACSFHSYKPAASSSATYPSDAESGIIADALGTNVTELHKSLMQINLYFEDFLHSEIKHSALYGNWFSVLAMLGGNMGLFLGASLMTIGEILEFSITTILAHIFT